MLRARDQEFLAFGGQMHAAGRAAEQGGAEKFLKLAQLRAQCRLRQADALGGAAKLPLFGDGDEAANSRQAQSGTHCKTPESFF